MEASSASSVGERADLQKKSRKHCRGTRVKAPWADPLRAVLNDVHFVNDVASLMFYNNPFNQAKFRCGGRGNVI